MYFLIVVLCVAFFFFFFKQTWDLILFPRKKKVIGKDKTPSSETKKDKETRVLPGTKMKSLWPWNRSTKLIYSIWKKDIKEIYLDFTCEIYVFPSFLTRE